MVSGRRVTFIAVAVSALVTVSALVLLQKPVRAQNDNKQPAQVVNQPSAIFDWNAATAKPTSFGSDRAFFKGPTATLDQLDVHVVTLNPGQAPHPPHQHANEEVLVVKEGTVEFLINGEWKPAGPGSAIFIASNQLHGVRNHGSVPVTFHVISWTSHH